MSLKLWLANKYDRPNTMIRIIVAILPKTITGGLGTYIVAPDFDPFEQTLQFGACGNNMLCAGDKDKGVKFLYDKIHRLGQQSKDVVGACTGRELTKVVKLWIKRKRSNKIIFDDTYAAITNKPLAVYAIPYEQYSTSTLDNVASLAGEMRLHFKDV
jgi:hypothetical protein